MLLPLLDNIGCINSYILSFALSFALSSAKSLQMYYLTERSGFCLHNQCINE